jgi:hypothetical protein
MTKPAWTLLITATVPGAAAGRASAQELGIYAGPLTGEHSHSYSWQLDYTEGIGRYFAGSVSWLNEGHIPDHHRDGPLVQLWGRLPVMDRRVVFAVGVGPYRYFDTEAAEQGEGYSNTHGWGVVYSARATLYSTPRWTANLQLNHVQVVNGKSTTATMLGIGYQLDAPDTPGPRDFALPRTSKVTDNEITVMAGATILNSLESQTSAAEAIEYRRGLTPYLDATLGYLHEGNGLSARRDGATAQRRNGPAVAHTRVLQRALRARHRRRRVRGNPSRRRRRHARYRRRHFVGTAVDHGVVSHDAALAAACHGESRDDAL